MPSIVPEAQEWPQYFVLCDHGEKIGLAWHEADPRFSDKETVLRWLVEGQFSEPLQVMEVNLPAGTSRDVSAEFAEEVRARSDGLVVSDSRRFVESLT